MRRTASATGWGSGIEMAKASTLEILAGGSELRAEADAGAGVGALELVDPARAEVAPAPAPAASRAPMTWRRLTGAGTWFSLGIVVAATLSPPRRRCHTGLRCLRLPSGKSRVWR